VPECLEKDNDNLMMQSDGYVTMDASDNHGISVPTGLMDRDHHFDDIPRGLRRRNEDVAKTQREKLRDMVINSHMTRPTKRLVS
jgi:hypothetical protein